MPVVNIYLLGILCKKQLHFGSHSYSKICASKSQLPILGIDFLSAGAAAAGAASAGAASAGAALAGAAMADAAAALLGDPVRRLGGRPLLLEGWGVTSLWKT
jgi:hypothetical protein